MKYSNLTSTYSFLSFCCWSLLGKFSPTGKVSACRGAGVPLPPVFGKSLNPPIPTRGADYSDHIITAPPPFLELPPSLRHANAISTLKSNCSFDFCPNFVLKQGRNLYEIAFEYLYNFSTNFFRSFHFEEIFLKMWQKRNPCAISKKLCIP